jgi:hypothetical protein
MSSRRNEKTGYCKPPQHARVKKTLQNRRLFVPCCFPVTSLFIPCYESRREVFKSHGIRVLQDWRGQNAEISPVFFPVIGNFGPAFSPCFVGNSGQPS